MSRKLIFNRGQSFQTFCERWRRGVEASRKKMLAEFLGALKAIVAILCQSTQHDLIEFATDERVVLRRRDDRFANVLVGHRYCGFAFERRPPGQHFI